MNPALLCELLAAFMAEYMSRINDRVVAGLAEEEYGQEEDDVWLDVLSCWHEMMDVYGLPLQPPEEEPHDNAKVQRLADYLREHAIRVAVDIDEGLPGPTGSMN